MNWRDYEIEIYRAFKDAYPNTKVKFNQKIFGRYSKVERQIDILIEGRIAGKIMNLAIDGKYYTKNVDVKAVESFLGMLEDIGIEKGILITSKGYSEGAINRAYYGPTDIELDILNFDELKRFQGFGGLVYSGSHGALIPAPFGWAIDATKRKGYIASIYQKGKSYDDALKDGEFIYVNIFSFNKEIKSLDDVIKLHEDATLTYHPKTTFKYFETVERDDEKKTLLRKILRKETHIEEYTGFVEIEDFCIFCVLFTQEELKNKNIRKLEYIIERLKPFKYDLKGHVNRKIKDLREQIKQSVSKQDKAELLITITEIYLEIEDTENAKKSYYESIFLFPKNYYAYLGLLEISYNSVSRDELINHFYELEPGNRKICDDLVRLGVQNKEIGYTEKFLLRKSEDEKGNFESLGNIFFSIGDLYYNVDNKTKALYYLKLAKNNFEKCLDKKHQALTATIKTIRELE